MKDNVFNAIKLYGNDDKWTPSRVDVPTGTLRGSDERIEVYRLRVAEGKEIFNELDSLGGQYRSHEYAVEQYDYLTLEDRELLEQD